jgi:diguanylate cyclase (GGDEF)-like protein
MNNDTDIIINEHSVSEFHLNKLMIQRAKILLIDDEPLNTDLLAFSLEREYLVKAVNSGEQALSLLKRFVPDLILLDIRMPNMDGFEVLSRLKSNQQTADIPVIFVTGEDSTDDELRGFELGAVDYVRKPFKIPLVLARISIHIDLKRKNDILENLACADGLTGISNRRKFDESLETLYQAALQNKSPLGLVMLDIDFFKQYNDYYGHSPGDDCLKKVASMLADVAKRATDIVARVGGEEFALILPNVTGSQLKKITNEIHQAMRQLAISHANSVVSNYVTVSIGAISVLPKCAGGIETLFERVDDLLYQAKAAGRATTVISELDFKTIKGLLEEPLDWYI